MTIEELLALVDLRQLPLDTEIHVLDNAGEIGPAAIVDRNDLDDDDPATAQWPNGSALVLSYEAT